MPFQQNEQIYSSLMDATPDCVKVLDLEGRLLHMNTPGLCAMEIDDFSLVSQQEWWTLWPVEARLDIEQSLARATKGEASSFEAYCPTAKGTPKWWDVSVSPIRDAASGRVERLLSVSRDITHRKDSEKALQLSKSRLAMLHGIVSDPSLSNPDRLAQLLRLGIDAFNLESGVIAQISDGVYRVALADTPDGSLSIGFSCDAKDVICVETLRSNRLLAIESLADSDWHTHPAYSQFGTEIYFGMPLQVDGQIYGTLCYTSRLGRVHKCSSGDHEFLRLLAQTIGTEMTRQQSATRLHAAEAEFRAIFELSPVGMTQVSVATGKFLRVNPKFCELTGYAAEELLKLTPEDITHRDDRAGGAEARQALHKGEIELYDREKRYLRKDNKTIWVQANSRLLRDAQGQPDRTTAVVQDITQRKLVEDALDESGKQFRQIVMNVSVPTMLHADDDTVLLVNHMWTHLTGYRLDDIPTLGVWTQKAFGEKHERAKAQIDKLFGADSREDNGEWAVTTLTGEKRLWHFSSTPLGRDADGRRLLISTAIDITEQTRAKQTLIESQQFTRNVLDNLSAFVGVLALDGTLLEANHAPLQGAGMSIDDVRGKKLWDTSWWSYSPQLQADLREWCGRAAVGKTVRCDVQVRMAGDTRVWIDFQVAPLRDADGQITHLIPSAVDISGRRQAEDQLRIKEERYRTLFDSMDQGYCVVEMLYDDGGRAVDYRFLEVNTAFERHSKLVGVVGQTMRTLVPEIEAHWFAIYGQVVETGEPLRFVDQSGAMENRWFDVYAFRIGDAASSKVAILFSDVSAQKRVEKELLESEDRFRNFADSIPQLAWIADVGSEGTIGWFNQGVLDYAGTTQEQMRGVGWKAIHHPDHIERVSQKFAHHVKNGLDWEDTFPLRRRDGEYRWFLSRMKCIRDDMGRVVQIFGTNTDITSEQQLEDKLRLVADDLFNANRRKDEFLATLAHELRNPLAPIRNGLQLMKLSGGQNDAVEQARAMMERQLTHMVRLVDDLMDASRISQGKLELRKQPISLNTVLTTAIESSGALIEQKRHQLIVKLPAQALLVDADLTRLAQVFQNLLNNAAKYSEEGGKIHLTVEGRGNDAVVTIRDAGVGIAADQLPLIFEMFTQVDRSLDMSQGGLGIGLSLVKRLVDMHGGRVEARSGGLGHGSEFVVTLPQVDQAAQHGTPGVDQILAAPQASLKILVVDDNRDGADSLSEMLDLMGNESRTGYDGEEAVSIAGEYQPDVILLDIGLPKLNGYEACRLIRQQPWGKDIVLIAVTGWGQEKDRSRTQQAGFDHHLVKPVDPQELMQLLGGLDISNYSH